MRHGFTVNILDVEEHEQNVEGGFLLPSLHRHVFSLFLLQQFIILQNHLYIDDVFTFIELSYHSRVLGYSHLTQVSPPNEIVISQLFKVQFYRFRRGVSLSA